MTAAVVADTNATDRALKNKSVNVLLLVVMLAASLLCFFARNTDSDNDPLGQMIVTENLIKHGHFSLDNIDQKTVQSLTYHVAQAANGRHYYYFPFGTTVMTIPIVATLDAFGWDMRKDEALAERVTCAIVAPLLILMLFLIGRRFTTPLAALTLASLMWLGTSLSSTGGLATWAHLTSTSFATLAILLVLRDPAVRAPSLRSLLGLVLFMAYFSRPTMSLLSPMMLLFIACRSWRSALWVGAVVAGLLALFFSANLLVFGEARPLFYAGDRLGTATYLTGVYGNLLGASRGLFVFSPFLLVPLFFVPRIAMTPRRALLILALGWPVLHLLVIADFPRWWAGFSFGPRYTMEVLPGLFVLLCLAWERASPTRWALPTAVVLSFLGAFSVFVHTFQGMFNPATIGWNIAAKTDEFPNLTLDWRWPQWAATESRNADLAAYRTALLEMPSGQQLAGSCLAPGTMMAPATAPADIAGAAKQGWATPDRTFVWSDGHVSKLDLCVDPKVKEIDLNLHAFLPPTLDAQHVTAQADGGPPVVSTFAADSRVQTVRVPLPADHGNSVRITLTLPDAVSPKALGLSDDARMLGVQLYGISAD